MMKLAVIPAAALYFATTIPAHACVAQYRHDPAKAPADIIVEGRAGPPVKQPRYGEALVADVKVSKVWLGKEQPRNISIGWYEQGGMCGPPSPAPKGGERLLVYVMKMPDGKLYPMGWSELTASPNAAAVKRTNDAAWRWYRDHPDRVRYRSAPKRVQ